MHSYYHTSTDRAFEKLFIIIICVIKYLLIIVNIMSTILDTGQSFLFALRLPLTPTFKSMPLIELFSTSYVICIHFIREQCCKIKKGQLLYNSHAFVCLEYTIAVYVAHATDIALAAPVFAVNLEKTIL